MVRSLHAIATHLDPVFLELSILDMRLDLDGPSYVVPVVVGFFSKV